MQSNQCSKCSKEPQLCVNANCGDVYCFLCLKAICNSNLIANNSKKYKCLKCLGDINVDINHVSRDFRNVLSEMMGKHAWLYMSKSGDGWWMFDPRTSKHIDLNYTKGIPECSYDIGDTKYIVRFALDEGYQDLCDVNNIQKQRKVKRVVLDKQSVTSMNIKGISGIFFKKIEDEIGKFLL